MTRLLSWIGGLRARVHPAVTECPMCAESIRAHTARTLAHLRFAPAAHDTAVDVAVRARDWAAARALHDRAVAGDLLVYELIRCPGGRVALACIEDPLGATLLPRLRRVERLAPEDAAAAWDAAR